MEIKYLELIKKLKEYEDNLKEYRELTKKMEYEMISFIEDTKDKIIKLKRINIDNKLKG